MAGWIAFILFGGFGAMLFGVGARQFYLQQRLLREARTVEAVIVHSEVRSHTSADTDSRALRSNSTTTHRPDVRFRYEVGGRPYESDLLHPHIIVTSYGSREAAAEILRPYPVGARVTAYVDPRHPDKGFLKREPTSAPGVNIVIGLVLVPLFWWLRKYL